MTEDLARMFATFQAMESTTEEANTIKKKKNHYKCNCILIFTAPQGKMSNLLEVIQLVTELKAN